MLYFRNIFAVEFHEYVSKIDLNSNFSIVTDWM